MEKLEYGVMDLYTTRRRIEAGESISQEAGDALFIANLKRLSECRRPAKAKMLDIYNLLEQAEKTGYNSTFIKQEYRNLFLEYDIPI